MYPAPAVQSATDADRLELSEKNEAEYRKALGVRHPTVEDWLQIVRYHGLRFLRGSGCAPSCEIPRKHDPFDSHFH
jgi:hypothetical protein